MNEMKLEKQNNYAFFLFGMCPLIPATANFAYGIVMAIAVWFVFFFGILANAVADMLDMNRSRSIFINFFIISLTTIFGFLLESFFPIIYSSIKIFVFILCFSYMIFLSLQNYYKDITPLELPSSYSILILALSIIREFFAFGTISFPVPSGFYSIYIPYFSTTPPLRFFGTTAAAFILLALAMWIYHSLKDGTAIPFR